MRCIPLLRPARITPFSARLSELLLHPRVRTWTSFATASLNDLVFGIVSSLSVRFSLSTRIAGKRLTPAQRHSFILVTRHVTVRPPFWQRVYATSASFARSCLESPSSGIREQTSLRFESQNRRSSLGPIRLRICPSGTPKADISRTYRKISMCGPQILSACNCCPARRRKYLTTPQRWPSATAR